MNTTEQLRDAIVLMELQRAIDAEVDLLVALAMHPAVEDDAPDPWDAPEWDDVVGLGAPLCRAECFNDPDAFWCEDSDYHRWLARVDLPYDA